MFTIRSTKRLSPARRAGPKRDWNWTTRRLWSCHAMQHGRFDIICDKNSKESLHSFPFWRANAYFQCDFSLIICSNERQNVHIVLQIDCVDVMCKGYIVLLGKHYTHKNFTRCYRVVVWTMLEQHCYHAWATYCSASALFQQYCSAMMKQQGCSC